MPSVDLTKRPKARFLSLAPSPQSLAPALTAFLYVLSFPKANLGLLGWVAFVPLLAALPFARAWRSAGLAFGAGFLANLGTLYWVYPTCRAGGVQPWAALLALVALSAAMALYWAAFGFGAGLFDRLDGRARPFALAAGWTALEWARTHLFTGFPWLLLGYSQWERPALIASAEYGGAYAVSFALMLANAAAAQNFRDRAEKRWDAGRRALPAAAALLVFFAASFAVSRHPVMPSGPPLNVAVAQGNVDQYLKWDQTYEDEIRRIYDELTVEAAVRPVDVVVWPETAVPGWVPNEEKYMDWLRDLSRRARAFLLVGAASHQVSRDYNAVFLFSPLGDLLGQYRKRHLVPFGEFIPWQPVLSKWVQVLNELGDFAGSDDWTVFETPKARLAANICFESLFPDLVRGFVARGAQVTVNMTNDGWYLRTAAPEQHFIASVFRAVETRTWVVRAANTGVSGFVHPSGRVTARTKLMERTLLREQIFPVDAQTFYVRRGDVFAKACAALAVLALLAALVNVRRKRL